MSTGKYVHLAAEGSKSGNACGHPGGESHMDPLFVTCKACRRTVNFERRVRRMYPAGLTER